MEQRRESEYPEQSSEFRRSKKCRPKAYKTSALDIRQSLEVHRTHKAAMATMPARPVLTTAVAAGAAALVVDIEAEALAAERDASASFSSPAVRVTGIYAICVLARVEVTAATPRPGMVDLPVQTAEVAPWIGLSVVWAPTISHCKVTCGMVADTSLVNRSEECAT
jgi:hypothetical protein